MKVLHVIPSLSAVHGGPSHAIAVMERALTAAGVQVETCATDDDGPGRKNGNPRNTPLLENGVTRRYFRKSTEFYKVSPALATWLVRHVREYDVVHIHALFSFSSVVAAWAARRAGVPYVLRPLGTLSRFGIVRRRPWIKRLSMRLVEGPLLESAGAVHFTSASEQAEALQTGLNLRGEVIPLAVEPAPRGDAHALLARHPALAGKQCLLFLSRLDPKKNAEGLLEAFSQVAADLPGVVLLVAGDGAPGYVETLKAQASRLGVGDRVIWAGRLDAGLKASAFAAAQAFVLPSYSENFGIAAAEALASGLPCILAHGVAIAADVEHAGAGIVCGTAPAEIAAAVRRMMGDAGLRERAGANALALATANYSPAAMGAALLDLYARLPRTTPRVPALQA